jgi:photosystem II stability/assembly factor-like uncharacterized protein
VYVVGDAFNIYKSTNLGANWTPVPFLAPVSQQPWTSTYNNLGFAGDTMVIVGNTGLINRSTNNGANWTTFTQYRKAGTLNNLHAESGTGKIWAVGSPGTTGSVFDQVMFSSNGGTNWTFQTVTGSTATFNSISMINSNTGYIGGTTGRVRKTTNGGTSWDSVATGVTFTINSIKFANANTGWIFGSTSGNIRKTTDGGTSWNAQTATGVTSAINSSALIDANTAWLVGSSGKVSKTTDGGANWVPQTSNYGSTINDIVMLNASTGYFVGLSGTMRKTTNGGTNWDTVVTPVVTTLNSVDFADAQNGFIGGTSGYTAKTTNAGSSWTLYNTGGSTVNAIFMLHADTAFSVGSTAEVHKYAQSPVGGITWKSEIPANYTLSQNYPNPFNPTTIIKFGLPQAGKVTLKVYDIAGREVGTYFNNIELNPGTVAYEFDGRNLASGVYFYSLFVNNNLIDSKKMLLVK